MSRFTGTLTIAWVALKRDRVQLPIWIFALTAFIAATAAIYDDWYETAEDLRTGAEFFAANPVARMFGLASGDSLGAYTLVETFTTLSVLAGLMSVLAVVRHTRQAEESRQAEMLASTVVGRYALLAAALIVAALANAALAVAVGLAFLLHGLPAEGSFAAGAALGAVGLAFGCMAAVAAQVYPNSRGASGIGGAAIGAAFLLAAVGSVLGTIRPSGVEVDPAWPSWLSPIGWGQLVRPFGEDNWWMLSLFFVSYVALIATAFALTDRRDVGRGLLPEGRGPATAARSLLTPMGLAWRLQRTVFLAWAAGIAAFGVIMGAMAGDIEEFLEEVDIADIFERIGGTEQVLDAYFVAYIGMLGTIISAYSVQVLLRMRIEEVDGPLESVLGAAISRPRWMFSYVANAVLGTLALLLISGVTSGLAAGLALDELGTRLPDLTLASLVHAPATFVVAAVALLAFAVLPRRAAGAAWAAFALALVAGPMFGEMLNLPQMVMDVSPFTHIPGLPVADFEVLPVAVLLAVAAALTATGFVVFRRRDLVLQ
jgi:ABC-2 type transport system permease protein